MEAPEYLVSIEKVAKYPYSNKQNMGSMVYCTSGLTGEPAEISEKLVKMDEEYGFVETDIITDPAMREDMLLELGDSLWYACRAAHELKYEIPEFPVNGMEESSRYLHKGEKNYGALISCSLRISANTGAIADMFKKLLRDDECDFEDDVPDYKTPEILEKIHAVLVWVDCAARELDSDISEVAQMNVTKLFDRYERNMLGGSGDHR